MNIGDICEYTSCIAGKTIGPITGIDYRNGEHVSFACCGIPNVERMESRFVKLLRSVQPTVEHAKEGEK